jgi:protein-S-isoprenylcysteine O-methyltransferase Ste14
MLANPKAWIALAAMAVVMAVLVFAAAGTVFFWRGWVFLGVFLAASAALTADLAVRDPALLERRFRGGPWAETRPVQRIVMTIVSVGFVALLAVPPLAWRNGWAPTSAVVSVAGDLLLALGYLAIHFVFRENSFAAATVRVGEGQRVISTGPYAWVRHPMYAASLVYLIGMALALGSWWGLVAVFAILPFLVWRLLDEERMLMGDLPGYREYMQKMRWRLIPGLY